MRHDGETMSINLLSNTIDEWALRVREYQDKKDRELAEQVRNWLFGAGLALQMLGDESLLEISKRALEASENGTVRNRTVGDDPGDDMGHSRLDSQRPDLADGGA